MLSIASKATTCIWNCYRTVSVDLLIEVDHYWSFFTGGIIRGDLSCPVALQTKLGWVLSRPATVPALTESCTVNLSATDVLKIEPADISHVQDDLQIFWDLETLSQALRKR